MKHLKYHVKSRHVMSGTEIAVCFPLVGNSNSCVSVSQYIIVQSIINAARSITVQSLNRSTCFNVCIHTRET